MPTNETLSQIMQPAQQAVQQPLQQGLELAQKANDLDAAKQKQQQMDAQLQNMQWSSAKGMLNTYMNASDPVKRAMKKQVGGRLQQLGADPTILDALDDDETQQNVRTAMGAMSDDPEQASKGMAALKRVDLFADGAKNYADLINQRSQQQMSRDLKEASLAGAQTVAGINAQGRIKAAEATGGFKQDRLNFNTHKAALGDINNDKQLNSLQDSYQNIDNAVSNFNASGHNPEEFALLQQALRKNAGISGPSGVGERAETYLHSVGMTAQQFWQKMSADPQDIMKSSPKLVDVALKVAQAERDNKQKQADAQIERKSGGYQYFYDNPDNGKYAEAFNQTVNSRRKQFNLPIMESGAKAQPSGSAAPPPTAAPPPLSQNQQDFMGKAQALKKPDGSAYSQAEIMDMMQKKGIK